MSDDCIDDVGVSQDVTDVTITEDAVAEITISNEITELDISCDEIVVEPSSDLYTVDTYEEVVTVDVTDEVTTITTDCAQGPAGPAGTGGIESWDIAAAYEEDNVVYYDGNIYVALRDTIGDQPDISTSDWLLITPSSAQSYIQFVFNSSGGQSVNRYNSWTDLMAVIHAGQEGPIKIIFEQNETLPTGTYNLDNVTLVGNGAVTSLGGTTITFPIGFNVSSWINGGMDGGLGISYEGTDPLVSYSSGINLFNLSLGNIISTTAAPFFDISNGGVLVLRIAVGASLLNSGSEPVSVSDASGLIVVAGNINAGFGNDIFSGDISAFSVALIIYESSSGIDPARTDSNLIGNFSYLASSYADKVGFDNSSNGFTATNVQDAIEEALGSFPNGTMVNDVPVWNGTIYEAKQLIEKTTTLFDETTTPGVIYIGKALPTGAAINEAGAVWAIKTIDTTADAEIKWADGVITYTKVWDNRVSYSYY